MPLAVYLAALCVAVSIPLLAWSVGGMRDSSGAVRRNLGHGLGQLTRPVGLGRSHAARRLLPAGYVEDLDRRLERAGVGARWTTDRYMAAKAVGMVVMFIVGAVAGVAIGGSAGVILPIVGALGAWVVPDLQLSGRANEREKEIDLQLPDVLDQLTISIEAGLGFDAALARLVATTDGPVVDQLARVLQDVRLGLPREAALRGVAERTQSPDLRTFANAMAQAGKHGLPMASVLRAQALEAREKRKFRAEERAHKVPVKILVPLVLCVLPALFIVLIGPAIIRYQDGNFGA